MFLIFATYPDHRLSKRTKITELLSMVNGPVAFIVYCLPIDETALSAAAQVLCPNIDAIEFGILLANRFC